MPRRLALVVTTAVVGVVLVAVAVVLVINAARSASVPTSVPHPSPTDADAVLDPTVWPEQGRGARLVHGVVGKRGQSRLVSTFTVDDSNLAWADMCDLPNVKPYATHGPLVAASVNGRLINETGCVPGDSTWGAPDMLLGGNPRAVRRDWASLGVKPGSRVTVRIWLVTSRGERITRPHVRLGFALYEPTGSR